MRPSPRWHNWRIPLRALRRFSRESCGGARGRRWRRSPAIGAVVALTALVTAASFFSFSAARGRNPELVRRGQSSQRALLSSTIQASTPELAPGRGLTAVEVMREEFHQLERKGPAGRGDEDDFLNRLRASLTAQRAAALAHSFSAPDLATPVGTTVLESWLEMDPLSASSWISVQRTASESHAWLVAHALAKAPESLEKFCNGLDAGPWADAFIECVGRELLHQAPAAAVALATSLPKGDRQSRLFETIAFDWMDRDPNAAANWIRGLQDPLLRHRLAAIGAQSYASTSPIASIEWLLDQTPGETLPLEPLATIFGIWTRTAPNEAAAWLKELQPGELAAAIAGKR